MPFQKGNHLAGSRKGIKNQRTLQIETIAEKFPNPFLVLMMFASGDWKGLGYDSETYVMESASGATKIGYVITPELRVIAAREACRYLYPMKKEKDDAPKEIEVKSIEQKKELLEKAQRQIEKLRDEILSADRTSGE
jgi:hypothetical protein